MRTIIFDVDGTLIDMWPIERSVLLRMSRGKYEKEINNLKNSGISSTYEIFTKATRERLSREKYWRRYNRAFDANLKEGNLPTLQIYPIVRWIRKNNAKYRFIYVTGGQEKETVYVLENLQIRKYFDVANSITKSKCRFAKNTGIPFRMVKKKFGECVIVGDGVSDRIGARMAKVEFVQINPNGLIPMFLRTLE